MVSTFCPSLAVSEIAKLVVKTFQRCSQYECWYICAYSAEKKESHREFMQSLLNIKEH